MDKLWFKARRVISVLLVFAMLASLTPVQVFADDELAATPAPTSEPVEGEPTPTPEVVAEPTPEVVATPTPEVVAEPTPEVVATPTPEVVATPTPEVVATPTPTPEVVATPTPEVVATPTPTPAETPASPAQAPANNPALLDEVDPTEGDGTGTEPTEEVPEYTVKFLYGYDKNEDGNEEDLIVEQIIAQGESAVAPNVPERQGYRFTGWDTEESVYTNVQENLTIKATWEAITTVTVTIKYQFTGGAQAAENYVENVVAGTDYNKTIESPVIEGYTADKPSVTIEQSAISADVTEIVTYTGTATTYTVRRYLQNVENDEYPAEPAYTDKYEGTAGEKTAIESKSYEGFTEGAIPEVTIAANGATTVDVYYTRNWYTLTWDTGAGRLYCTCPL